jgi:hypothetical protein
MRIFLSGIILALGCGSHTGDGTDGKGSGSNNHPDACVGLQCQVDASCAQKGMPATSISGTVYAPNGTLPLYGITVYVPNGDPGPMPSGPFCNQCGATQAGSPVGLPVTTDEMGHFTLNDMPSGSNIPLVITTGKWRRIINLGSVASCGDNAISNKADTTLPKSIDDATPNTMVPAGWTAPAIDMPHIAITTGGCDQLECLARRLGIADKEFTASGGSGHVHLYAGTGGVNQFDSGWPGGAGALSSATPFWGGTNGTPATLNNYDIVMLSCECGQNPGTKPQPALDAMKAYADAGGRVFASHWHNIWIGGAWDGGGTQAPAIWAGPINTGNKTGAPGIAGWKDSNDPGTPDIIDEVNNPKGVSFATWMLNVMGSTVRDQIDILPMTDRSTCTTLDNTKAEQWTYTGPQAGYTPPHPQNFQFTTPNEQPPTNRCGKVVFSDMHVSGGPNGNSFASSCGGTTTLSAQEKALAFMFFDISSCVNTTIQ